MDHEENNLGTGHHAQAWSQWTSCLLKDPRPGSKLDYHLHFEVPGFRKWTPGQFVMLRWGQHIIGRPFSIFEWKPVRGKNSSQLHLVVRKAGEGTTDLIDSLRAGSRVVIQGPLGNVPFKSDLETSLHPWVYVTEGARLAAVFAILERRKKLQLAANLPLDVWWHFESHRENLDSEIFSRAYVKPDQVFLNPTGQPAFDFSDLPAGGHVLCVGSGEFLESVAIRKFQQSLQEKNSSVWLRSDTTYGCGVGLCFSCSIQTSQGPKRSCTEGPWFKLGSELSL